VAFIQTTKTTLAGFKQHIPWQSLTKIFQNAIFIAYGLGLNYIWIDSLCICQDDAEDWACEGSKMDSIYSGGHITLAFSQSRESYFMYDGTCRTKEWAQGELSYEVTFRQLLKHADSTVDTMPLLGRAWVLQERYLSSRVVYFVEQELIWECLETETCQCQDKDAAFWRKSTNKAILSSYDYASYGVATCPERKKLWLLIIEEYSKQHLTFQRDIFPAIQGIAKRLHRNCAATSYAGMWSSDFHLNMLWETTSPQETVRPDVWRAPSWSWASVVGRVAWAYKLHTRDMRPIAHLVDISTTPVGEDSLGELEAGFIRMSGPCVPASLHRNDTVFRVVFEGQSEYLLCNVDYLIPFPEISPPAVMECYEQQLFFGKGRDVWTVVQGYENVILIWIGEVLIDGGENVKECLALRSIDAEQHTYERFGIVVFGQPHVPNMDLKFESKTITIV
jgi:hypothetical protein